MISGYVTPANFIDDESLFDVGDPFDYKVKENLAPTFEFFPPFCVNGLFKNFKILQRFVVIFELLVEINVPAE